MTGDTIARLRQVNGWPAARIGLGAGIVPGALP